MDQDRRCRLSIMSGTHFLCIPNGAFRYCKRIHSLNKIQPSVVQRQMFTYCPSVKEEEEKKERKRQVIVRRLKRRNDIIGDNIAPGNYFLTDQQTRAEVDGIEAVKERLNDL